MESKPIISYVIPCYNCESTVFEAIYSIRDGHESLMREKGLPSYWNRMEVVCVNDGSTDATKDILDSMASHDQNIKVIHLENNMGKGFSRNLGNKNAQADIIAVLDSDDWNISDRTSTILKTFIQNPGKDIFYSGFMTVHVDKNTTVPFKATRINKDTLRQTGEFGICHSTVAYKREVILKEPYSEDRNKDDWSMLWNFFSKGYQFCYSPKILVAYRADEATIQKESSEGKQDRILKKKQEIMEPHFNGN